MLESPAPEMPAVGRVNPYDTIVTKAMTGDASITYFLPTRGTHLSPQYYHLGEYCQKVRVNEIPKKGEKGSKEVKHLPLYLREHSTELVKLVIEKQLDGLSLDEKNQVLKTRQDELEALGFLDAKFDKTKGFTFTNPSHREDPFITANRIKIAEEDINRFAFVLSAVSQDLDPVCVVRNTAHRGTDFRTQKGAETVKAIVTRFENLQLENGKSLAPDELLQGIRQAVGYAEYEWIEFTKQGMREKLDQELLLAQLSSLRVTERINPPPKFGEFMIAEGITTLPGEGRAFVGERRILPEAKPPTKKGEKIAPVEPVVLLDWLAARYADIFISPKFLVEEQKMKLDAEAFRQKAAKETDVSTKTGQLKKHLELEAQVRENRQIMRLVILEKLGFNLEKQYAGNQAMLDYVKSLKYRLEPGPLEGQTNVFLSDRYEQYTKEVGGRWSEIMARNLKIDDIQPALLGDVIAQLRHKKLTPKEEKHLIKLLDNPDANKKISEAFSDLGISVQQLEVAKRLFTTIQWNYMREMTAEERMKKGFQGWTTTRVDAEGKSVDNGIFSRVGLHLNDPKINSLKTLEDHLAKGYKSLFDSYAEKKIEDPKHQEEMREIVKPAATTVYPDGSINEETGKPLTYPRESSDGVGNDITRRKIQSGETQKQITVEETDQGLRFVEEGAKWNPPPPEGAPLSTAQREQFSQEFNETKKVLEELERAASSAAAAQATTVSPPAQTTASPAQATTVSPPAQTTASPAQATTVSPLTEGPLAQRVREQMETDTLSSAERADRLILAHVTSQDLATRVTNDEITPAEALFIQKQRASATGAEKYQWEKLIIIAKSSSAEQFKDTYEIDIDEADKADTTVLETKIREGIALRLSREIMMMYLHPIYMEKIAEEAKAQVRTELAAEIQKLSDAELLENHPTDLSQEWHDLSEADRDVIQSVEKKQREIVTELTTSTRLQQEFDLGLQIGQNQAVYIELKNKLKLAFAANQPLQAISAAAAPTTAVAVPAAVPASAELTLTTAHTLTVKEVSPVVQETQRLEKKLQESDIQSALESLDVSIRQLQLGVSMQPESKTAQGRLLLNELTVIATNKTNRAMASLSTNLPEFSVEKFAVRIDEKSPVPLVETPANTVSEFKVLKGSDVVNVTELRAKRLFLEDETIITINNAVNPNLEALRLGKFSKVIVNKALIDVLTANPLSLDLKDNAEILIRREGENEPIRGYSQPGLYRIVKEDETYKLVPAKKDGEPEVEFDVLARKRDLQILPEKSDFSDFDPARANVREFNPSKQQEYVAALKKSFKDGSATPNDIDQAYKALRLNHPAKRGLFSITDRTRGGLTPPEATVKAALDQAAGYLTDMNGVEWKRDAKTGVWQFNTGRNWVEVHTTNPLLNDLYNKWAESIADTIVSSKLIGEDLKGELKNRLVTYFAEMDHLDSAKKFDQLGRLFDLSALVTLIRRNYELFLKATTADRFIPANSDKFNDLDKIKEVRDNGSLKRWLYIIPYLYPQKKLYIPSTDQANFTLEDHYAWFYLHGANRVFGIFSDLMRKKA